MPTLTWAGKDEATRAAKLVPYRLLEEDSSLSYGDAAGNMIVQGDNLAALKALLPYYRGQVRCIYIDILTQKTIQFNYSRRAA
ncbi:MAG: hypothetical protein IJ849_00595 [Selenomonadaceae bacterium]|nr:hypothetical protein [Selenomonadaceae bacterium]